MVATSGRVSSLFHKAFPFLAVCLYVIPMQKVIDKVAGFMRDGFFPFPFIRIWPKRLGKTDKISPVVGYTDSAYHSGATEFRLDFWRKVRDAAPRTNLRNQRVPIADVFVTHSFVGSSGRTGGFRVLCRNRTVYQEGF